MSLLDHFRPPLSEERDGLAFLGAWACSLAGSLNTRLPERHYAAPNVWYSVEIDAATSGDITAARRVPVEIDEPHVEVAIYDGSAGPVRVGAIELVGPANKDRPARRAAFTTRCAERVQGGLGLVVVDVVTAHAADLHGQLLARLGSPTGQPIDTLHAAAYRPVERDGSPVLDIWHEPLAVGRPLPTLPLWLRGGLCLPIDLQATYDRTCRDLRVPAA